VNAGIVDNLDIRSCVKISKCQGIEVQTSQPLMPGDSILNYSPRGSNEMGIHLPGGIVDVGHKRCDCVNRAEEQLCPSL
jgi:hypothetical protein